MRGDGLAVRAHHRHLQRLAVFGAEVEDVADLDAPALAPARRVHAVPCRLVVLLVGRRIQGRHLVEEPGEVLGRAIVQRRVGPVHRLEAGVVKHAAFAGRSQHDELVAEVAADRPGIGHHRNRLQPQPLEGPHVGQHHLAVADDRTLVVHIEAVAVLHQELAAAHHAEPRADLVAKLPLDVIEHLRQLTVALHRLAQQFGDHLFVGRPVQHLPVTAVPDPQHFRPVGVVAPALAPQLRRLNRGHQQLLRTGPVLLLAHHLFNATQHPQPRRQPGVDPGRGLPHQPGPQHQPVRHDLCLGRNLLDGGDERAGEAHRSPAAMGGGPYRPRPRPASRATLVQCNTDFCSFLSRVARKTRDRETTGTLQKIRPARHGSAAGLV